MFLFIIGVVVSVELDVTYNIHIGDNERGGCVSDVSTVNTLVFSIFRRTVGRLRKFFSLNPSAPQGESILKISVN